jgi:hypothetical protein
MSALLPPSAAAAVDASFRGIARFLAQALPGADIIDPEQPSFEVITPPSEPARTISAEVIEGRELRVHRVFDPPMPGIAAFLDGTQSSRAVHYLSDGAPIVHGTAAAVIRERRNKRLFTWRHLVVRRLYLARERVPASLWRQLAEHGIELRDTSERAVDGSPEPESTHPLALREAAIHLLQKDRERAEQSLALEWCARENRPILIDGGISAAEPVARAGCAVGVVKSHRTLYADGDALGRVFALRRGERSSVFRVTSPKRATVASWYLRLHDRHGHDPMWGLVRVEIAAPGRTSHDEIGDRADEVSRWILAEATPVALPDARWDKMVYGIRDCEEFLRAVV